MSGTRNIAWTALRVALSYLWGKAVLVTGFAHYFDLFKTGKCSHIPQNIAPHLEMPFNGYCNSVTFLTHKHSVGFILPYFL